jgi:hypothetical protein
MRKLVVLTKRFCYGWMSPHLQFQRSNCYLVIIVKTNFCQNTTINRRGIDNNSIRNI